MKLNKGIIALLTGLAIMSCSDEIQVDIHQMAIDSFSDESGCAALVWTDNGYAIVPKKEIRGAAIKKAIENQQFGWVDIGLSRVVTLNGVSRADYKDGDGCIYHTYDNNTISSFHTSHSTGIWTLWTSEKNIVSYKSNSLILDNFEMKVFELTDEHIMFIIQTDEDKWECRYWERRPIQEIEKHISLCKESGDDA